MATETRHAAWQTERSFAVRLLPEDGPPADLASGLTDFLDAFDLAFEWVSREDPARDGAATLAILETRDGVAAEVWTYPPAEPGNDQDVVARLGFDPLTWNGVAREFSAGERSMRPRREEATAPRASVLAGSSGSTRPSTAALEASSPSVDGAADGLTSVAPSPVQAVAWPARETITTDYDEEHSDNTERATVHATARRLISARARVAWDDPISRWCLILAGASLWFSVGLVDPLFLVPLLLFLPALWWRQRDRGGSAAEADSEDWL